jgi:hypothetical protein
MACVVCKRDVSESAAHRECILTLFKEKKIKGVADWIRLSSKPRTILKGRVLRVLEPATNAETPPTTG